MKVVIDIPENDYWLACNYPDALISIYAHYIKKGILLPKKHGRLIDADVLLLGFELAQKSADMDGREYANAFRSAGGELSTEWWAVEDIVKNANTVIDAEGE